MNLLELPLEILEQMFLEFIRVRNFKRAMRLRLVNRKFQQYTNDAMFRSRMLDKLITHYDIFQMSLKSPWISFVQTYLARRILLGIDHGFPGGLVRRLAEHFCEMTGETEDYQLYLCIRNVCGMIFLLAEKTKIMNLINSVAEEECTAEQFEWDILLLAIYTNNSQLAKQLLSEKPKFEWPNPGSKDNHNLERCIQIATYQGNLEIIKFLTATDSTSDTGFYHPLVLDTLLGTAYVKGTHDLSTQGHHAILNFALKTTGPHDFISRWSGSRLRFEEAMHATASPDTFVQTQELLGLEDEIFWPPRRGKHLLRRMIHSAQHGQIEMIKYCLERGVYLNIPDSKRTNHKKDGYTHNLVVMWKPLLFAVKARHENVTKLLLESGADPNWFDTEETALMAAVRGGNPVLVRMLIDYGANINEGCPPPIVIAVLKEDLEMFRFLREKGAVIDTPETGPWAMTFAAAFGLDSMIDSLCQEGVERGVVLHRVSCQDEAYTWHFPR